MSKVILVTGTSTGLGISIAVQAAQAGHTVYATMRNLAKRAALDAAAKDAGVSLKVLALDVQDSASVQAAVDTIIKAEGRIDTLVNNAGAGFVRSTEQATEAEVDWVMDVNFKGVVRCTKAVLPHMRTARSGHVLTVSSVGGLVGQPFNELYCAAKFAVEGYTEAMASYITPSFGINFTTVEPGGIASEFANNALAQIEGTGGILDDEYKPILMKYVGGAENRQNDGVYQTADEVAEVVMGALEADTPPVRVRTSKWAEDFCALKTQADPDGTKLAKQVFERFLG
ncbi:SDR family oxidoreductase [Lentibacter algarum]|uniref:SDR family oxidoreductase n=1 Tax=Lentibacter algarum TaxID=576131 RepID=UPI001C06D392|nr:SDR family oxidoreductase [Lentibacter algarum]MBU2981780.1 SDR family oxidoreductase [Lentibacter algarum]